MTNRIDPVLHLFHFFAVLGEQYTCLLESNTWDVSLVTQKPMFGVSDQVGVLVDVMGR